METTNLKPNEEATELMKALCELSAKNEANQCLAFYASSNSVGVAAQFAMNGPVPSLAYQLAASAKKEPKLDEILRLASVMMKDDEMLAIFSLMEKSRHKKNGGGQRRPRKISPLRHPLRYLRTLKSS